MNPEINIPKAEQLAALADGLPAVYRLIKKYTGGQIQTDFREFITVSKSELAEYLRANPSLATKHVMTESEALKLDDRPALLRERGKWLVCFVDYGSKMEKAYFDDLSEAAANFLMVYWPSE